MISPFYIGWWNALNAYIVQMLLIKQRRKPKSNIVDMNCTFSRKKADTSVFVVNYSTSLFVTCMKHFWNTMFIDKNCISINMLIPFIHFRSLSTKIITLFVFLWFEGLKKMTLNRWLHSLKSYALPGWAISDSTVSERRTKLVIGDCHSEVRSFK